MCQALHHGLAVLSVVVLDGNTGLPWLIGNVEGNLELRHIQFHGLVGRHLLTAYTVIAENAHLVGEHNVSLETVVGSNTCKRIVLVGKGLLEGFLAFVKEFLHALRTYPGRERKGVHKHTHRIGHLQIVAAVGYGGDAYMVVAREAGEAVEYGTEQHGRRLYALFLCKLLGITPYNGSPYTAVFALWKGIAEVWCQLSNFLDIAKALSEELGS